jgi:aspartyl aminopeptidase
MTSIQHQQIDSLLSFLDQGVSPWHAVASVKATLEAAGFKELLETDDWPLEANQRYFVIRDGSSIIAFITANNLSAETGFHIAGAHTDSPTIRIKPNPNLHNNGAVRLAVEVYGGTMLPTFIDRDLSLAGRVSLKSSNPYQQQTALVDFKQALLRIPSLAIHLNRTVNDEGLCHHKQDQYNPMLGYIAEDLPKEPSFNDMLAKQLGIDVTEISGFEVNVYDTQGAARYGAEQEFFASSRIDNLASVHASLSALVNADTDADKTRVIALFDHEEIGSNTFKGADGSFIDDVLERISLSSHTAEMNHTGQQARSLFKRALANSYFLSIDMAHAWNPSFSDKHDVNHRPRVNQGPAIKFNANQNYTTDAVSEAMFMHLCELADVPLQKFVSRNDMPCGSTIGPKMAARLGIRAIDIGNPMWSMHSIRESAGVKDHLHMIDVLGVFFN